MVTPPLPHYPYCTPYSTAPNHNTPHHITLRPRYATLHPTTPHFTTPHHTTPHYTTLHHTTPNHTTPQFQKAARYVRFSCIVTDIFTQLTEYYKAIKEIIVEDGKSGLQYQVIYTQVGCVESLDYIRAVRCIAHADFFYVFFILNSYSFLSFIVSIIFQFFHLFLYLPFHLHRRSKRFFSLLQKPWERSWKMGELMMIL